MVIGMTNTPATSQPSPRDAADHTRQALLAVQRAVAGLLEALETLGDTGAFGCTPNDAQDASGLLAPLVSDPRIASFYRKRLDQLAHKLQDRYPSTPITARTIGQLMRYWPAGTIEIPTTDETGASTTVQRPWTLDEQRAWAIKALVRDGRLVRTTGKDRAGRFLVYYTPQPPPALRTPDKVW